MGRIDGFGGFEPLVLVGKWKKQPSEPPNRAHQSPTEDRDSAAPRGTTQVVEHMWVCISLLGLVSLSGLSDGNQKVSSCHFGGSLFFLLLTLNSPFELSFWGGVFMLAPDDQGHISSGPEEGPTSSRACEPIWASLKPSSVRSS